MGTLFGPAIGVLAIVALEVCLASVGSWMSVIEGLMFVLGFREGIGGKLRLRSEITR